MSAYGFVFPVQPGKESIIREMGDYLRSHSAEYAESRRRVGLTVERAYLQRNPDGSTLVVAYGVGDRPPSQVMEAYLASDLPLDRMFIDRNGEATGIDFRAAARGPAPEQVAEWAAPGANGRKRGFAFAAPLAPGRTDAARAFAREAYQARRAELTES